MSEFNPDAADRQTDRFHALFAKLAETPGIGSRRDELLTEMRCRGIGKYLVYYRVEGASLVIIRVVHGARHQEALFGEYDDPPDETGGVEGSDGSDQ